MVRYHILDANPIRDHARESRGLDSGDRVFDRYHREDRRENHSEAAEMSHDDNVVCRRRLAAEGVLSGGRHNRHVRGIGHLVGRDLHVETRRQSQKTQCFVRRGRLARQIAEEGRQKCAAMQGRP